MYQRAYDLLTNNRITKITTEDRLTILTGIFQLYLRNPIHLKKSIQKIRNDIEKIYKICLDTNRSEFIYLSEKFDIKNWEAEGIINHFIEKLTANFKETHLIGTRQVIEFHANAKLEVSYIIDSSNFFTSDNPLAFQDIVSKNNYHPLLKTKEFIIPLNNKFVLRILHDNTKELNFIYRKWIPNGDASLINSTIEEHTSRFLIGTQEAFKEYFKFSEILEDTSTELKINTIRQIVLKIPEDEENSDVLKVMRKYLDIYDKNGTLSNLEEYEMCMKINELGKLSKRKKI
jgi:hypothetical protein